MLPLESLLLPKYVLLMLACGLMLGSSFGKWRDYLNISVPDYQYRLNLMYSVYSIPNIILPLFGGHMLQSMGLTTTLFALTSCVFTGVLTSAIALSLRFHSLDVFGRILQGIGSECLCIAQSALIARHFHASDLAFAMSIAMTLSRLSSVFTYNFFPKLSDMCGVDGVAWWVASVGLFSVICVSLIWKIEQKIAAYHLIPSANPQTDPKEVNIDNDKYFILTHFNKAFRQLPRNFWLLTISLVCFYVACVAYTPIASDFYQTRYFPNDHEKAGRLASVPDIISVILMPFLGLWADFLRRRSFLRQSSSGNIALPPSPTVNTAMPLSHDAWWYHQMMWSGLCILFAHTCFAIKDVTHMIWLPVAILGIGYSGFASIVYGVMADMIANRHRELSNINAEHPRGGKKLTKKDVKAQMDAAHSQPVSEEAMIATAYGVSGCLLNLAFCIVPMILAWLLGDGKSVVNGWKTRIGWWENAHSSSVASPITDRSYVNVEYFFALVALVGVVSTWLMRHGGK